MDDVVKQIVLAAVSAVVSAVVGLAFERTRNRGKPTAGQFVAVLTVSLGIGLVVFAMTYWNRGQTSSPAIQSIEAKPIVVRKGDWIAVTIELDKQAPRGGVSVALDSSDPASLAINGNAKIPQGATIGTAYVQAIKVPAYPAPISILATYNKDTLRAAVSVLAQPSPVPSPFPPASIAARINPPNSQQPSSSVKTVAGPHSETVPAAAATAVRPATLDPEVSARLEEAQGRLNAEKGYWENVKTHMPPGTSLRPEIRSQIYAAESASQRCTKEQHAAEAGTLPACIDSLNDHLNQLRIQH